MAQVVQVKLVSFTGVRTCWVSASRPFKVGSQLTLKNSEDPKRRWTVVEISEPRDSAGLHSDWKVGGL